MYRLIYGSIFDSKCDLLIIPCDSGGGVTHFVYSSLSERGLPTYFKNIKYGSVLFEDTNYEFANTIGYAASVNRDSITSSDDAIQTISHKILNYAERNSVNEINMPLIGTGAGGIDFKTSFEIICNTFSKSKKVVCKIYVINKDAYLKISDSISETQLQSQIDIPNPRVFISYTGLDRKNSIWTKKLADILISKGVNARIDQYHLRPGFDLPQWMTNEVILAEKVLLICDNNYMQKADFRKGGVGWETMIIQGDMLAQGDNKQKYIAIIREENPNESLPEYMKSKYAFNWGIDEEINEERLRKLLEVLFEIDIAPEIGPIPDYILEYLVRKKNERL